MCVLEIITREEPYKECNNSTGRIVYRIRHGIYPKALYSVSNAAAREFIQRCLLPYDQRPSAHELLSDPFLSPNDTEDDAEIILPRKFLYL